jgi:hypothetical protein
MKSSATPRPEVQAGRHDGWLNVVCMAELVMNLRAIGGTHLDEFGSHSFAVA